MDQPIEKVIKKAKRKQWMKMILVAFIVSIVLLITFYRVGNYFAAKSTQRLHETLFLQNAIMQPNVQIDSQVTQNRSMFGGEIVTNRSKEVNGYTVVWSTLTSQYGWIKNEVAYNELVPGFHSDGENSYEYDKQTKQKYATFYHPNIKNYYDGVQNELAEVAQLENHVAEVAISFKEPMTFAQIKASVPNNLNIVWYYMLSREVDEEYGPSGLPVYGFGGGEQVTEIESFIEVLKQYDDNGDIEEIQQFIRAYEGKPLEEVKVLGVMLTGQAGNFTQLIDADFVRGASVGVTAEIVPYIQPTK